MDVHESVIDLWHAFLYSIKEDIENTKLTFKIDRFGDNKQIADEAAYLVLAGKKRATSPSLWELELIDEPVPKSGDYAIIINWAGYAQCIIQTTSVDITLYDEISPAFARLEGEGDGSLEYWRSQHWAYYHRVLHGTKYSPSGEMPIICERFNLIYPKF
jgi:uncharacterized protein YhfF